LLEEYKVLQNVMLGVRLPYDVKWQKRSVLRKVRHGLN